MSQPFEAIPVAVPLAGISSLLLVVFWLVAARSLPVPGSRSASVARIFCVGAAAAIALVGGSQLIAAASGSVLGVVGPTVGLAVWFVATVLPITASALLIAVSAGVRARIVWSVLLLATLGGDELAEYVLLEPIDSSYDSPPGIGYPGAAGLLLAGIAFAVAAFTAGRRRTAAPGGSDPASGPPRPAQSLSNPFS
ncbi:hypothetical protein B7R22_15135 [Subtercola boreus]|uniref:Uncharacterized protein n=1 Tax=Subtercola boreus TaxID=120213 RepID=A0A3E0VRF3_9MICO|nr:hypothetical protein [Subtercola boreus]RFA12456.1 hypothetical protein B7R22_15135 [Subtercola boreus]